VDKQTVGTYFGKYRLYIKSRNDVIEKIWTITPYGDYAKLTDLPLVFLYDFYRDDTESDKYWMRGRLAEIDREIAQRVAADLERQENFDRWKVSVATKRNDMFESLF